MPINTAVLLECFLMSFLLKSLRVAGFKAGCSSARATGRGRKCEVNTTSGHRYHHSVSFQLNTLPHPRRSFVKLRVYNKQCTIPGRSTYRSLLTTSLKSLNEGRVEIENLPMPMERSRKNIFDNSEFDVILSGLNEAQIEAVTQPTESITRVVAGPGAGKTRVLTSRIAYLLKRESLDRNFSKRILAVTFTKKAASEMQHRLDSLLREDEEYQQAQFRSHDIESNTSQTKGVDEIIEELIKIDDDNNGQRIKPIVATRVTMGTFHSICAKILRWNGQELASLPLIAKYLPKNSTSTLDGSFAIIDQAEQIRIINQCLKELDIDLKGTKSQDTIRPITILNAVGQLKSDEAMGKMVGESTSNKSSGMKLSLKVRTIAKEVYPLYRKTLLSQNSLDFDDLILMTRDLLQTNAEVRERMQKRWNHILVDEFQDTSEVQLDLVRLLTTSSLLVVGDGDQSIYSWRGAHAESMNDFVKAFNKKDNRGGESKQVNTVFLMENYRSTSNIVNAAQKVISDPLTKDRPQESFRKDMKPMRGAGPSPRVLASADSKAEATFVAKEINKMCEEGTLGPTSTVALIYRTNAQSRALEEACVAHNVQYLVRGNVGTFYSRAEIKDCLCFLRWLYNGRDLNAMNRAMKTPSRGLGEVSINEFIAYCNEVENQPRSNDQATPSSPLDVLVSLASNDPPSIPTDGIITKRTLNKLLPFASQMKEIVRKAETQTIVDLLGNIIETLDLKSHFDSISKTSEEFADRWANVNELRGASERYTNDGPCFKKRKLDDESESMEISPLGNFLDDVSLLSDDTRDDDNETIENDRRLVVNLMTIHASKGMEFDCVFLVGNEEGTFPTQRAISEGEGSVELDEERRLCYVAMTRAKTHLIMTWRREVQTFFGAGFRYSHPERSRFLDRLVAKSKKKDEEKVKESSSSPERSKSRFGSQVAADSQKGWHRTVTRDPRNQERLSKSPRSVVSRAGGTIDLSRTGEDQHKQKPKKKQRSQLRESNTLTERRIQSRSELSTEKRPRRESPPPIDIDASLFFPVGTVVRHPIHGQGTVIQPKPISPSGKIMVTVHFQNEMIVDFPVNNSGLIIKY